MYTICEKSRTLSRVKLLMLPRHNLDKESGVKIELII